MAIARALSGAERVLLPLDRARATFNRIVLGSALGEQLVRKDRRIALRAIAAIVVATAVTLRAPVLLYALAPVLLGVPHLAADLRYLVLRPEYSRVARIALLVGCVPFLAVRALPLLGLPDAKIEMALAAAALVIAAAVTGWQARRWVRLAWVLLSLITVGALAWHHAVGARLVFSHLHNVVALVAWAWLFRDRRGSMKSLLLPIAFALFATLVVVAQGADLDTAALQRPVAFGLSLATLSAWLAPGLPLAWGVPIALSFVFLQSMHYSVWLALVPAESIRGDAGRSYRMSMRALVRDFGSLGLIAIVSGSAVLMAWATRDVNTARNAYLSLAGFHGYLELSVLVIALCGQRALFAPAA